MIVMKRERNMVEQLDGERGEVYNAKEEVC